jgi:predicted DsbA family dithiol-disulfide isomerase
MVRLTYYTDPACPWSWAGEPALRRLQMEFGIELQITYVMAGMARELDDPSILGSGVSGHLEARTRHRRRSKQLLSRPSTGARRPSCGSWPLSGARPERVGLGELFSPTA